MRAHSAPGVHKPPRSASCSAAASEADSAASATIRVVCPRCRGALSVPTHALSLGRPVNVRCPRPACDTLLTLTPGAGSKSGLGGRDGVPDRLLERALRYAGSTHSLADIDEALANGTMQCWPCLHSVVITQVVSYPRLKELRVCLAAGRLKEIEAITPVMLDWARKQGCTRAVFAGRRGWLRAFPAKSGWTESTLTIMERSL